MKQNISRSRSG